MRNGKYPGSTPLQRFSNRISRGFIKAGYICLEALTRKRSSIAIAYRLVEENVIQSFRYLQYLSYLPYSFLFISSDDCLFLLPSHLHLTFLLPSSSSIFSISLSALLNREERTLLNGNRAISAD